MIARVYNSLVYACGILFCVGQCDAALTQGRPTTAWLAATTAFALFIYILMEWKAVTIKATLGDQSDAPGPDLNWREFTPEERMKFGLPPRWTGEHPYNPDRREPFPKIDPIDPDQQLPYIEHKPPFDINLNKAPFPEYRPKLQPPTGPRSMPIKPMAELRREFLNEPEPMSLAAVVPILPKDFKDQRLSPNFLLSEFLKSRIATAYGIDNYHPTQNQISAMRNLCKNVLEPIRAAVRQKINPKAVVVLTSGWRCPELNLHPEVKGTKTSQHPKGQAGDIHVEDGQGKRIMTAQELFDFILIEGIVFDQMIQEYDQWVHISWRLGGSESQRRQTLYIYINQKGQKVTSARSPKAGAAMPLATLIR